MTTHANPVIELSEVTRRYTPESVAVTGLCLQVMASELAVILGPSGSGKTTTLRLIAGFERPDAGEVRIAGRVVASSTTFVSPERRGVGIVFQDYALFPHLTVAGNLGFGLRGKEWPDRVRRGRVQDLLELVGLTGLGGRYPHELSGGQQQRVALARALAPKPDVVLLDEPFSNLDTALRARVRAEVAHILRAAGATAVFVTHDQEEALSMADRVAIMWAGRVVQMDTPENLYHHPVSRDVAAFVGEANFFKGEAKSGSVRCELGMIASRGAADGEVELLLRPEYVLPRADDPGAGSVVAKEFYGHDQLFTVRLDSGTLVRALVGQRREESQLRLGQRVRLEVSGEAVAYPQAEALSEPRP